MANARFQEYVTSGTFTLTLSRNQVSALSLIANGEGRSLGVSDSILERKGLVELVAAPEMRALDAIEFRPTLAGFLAIEMLREAALINFQGGAIGNEVNALRAELIVRRTEAVASREKMISALARKNAAEHDLAEAVAKISRLETCIRAFESGLTLRGRASMLDEAGDPQHTSPRVVLRDPLPNLSDEQLRGPP
jgi:hypothetical protein